jgi:hypothetical protein
MKKSFLTFIFTVVCFNLSAQEQYKPVLDSTIVKWSVLSYGIGADLPLSSFEFVAYGDTIINGIPYKPLYRYAYYFSGDSTNTEWQNYLPNIFYEIDGYYIRESQDASKLYIYEANYDTEYLISDLDLQIGDSFMFPSDYLFSVSAVVDSIFIKNERKHIRLHMPSSFFWADTIMFVEGVGTSVWSAFNFGMDRAGILNCFQNHYGFYKMDVIPYLYCDYPCGGWANFAESKQIDISNLYIFVNNDLLEIKFDNNKNLNIELLSIDGRLLYKNDFPNTNNIIIQTNIFPKGIFLLKITDKNTNQSNINKIIL